LRKIAQFQDAGMFLSELCDIGISHWPNDGNHIYMTKSIHCEIRFLSNQHPPS
jgi:hypothetical protein